MWPNPQETAELVTFTEEILNGKLHFLLSDNVTNQLKLKKKGGDAGYIHKYDAQAFY